MPVAPPFAIVQFTAQQRQILALAAVFQAAQLVQIVANVGTHRLGELGNSYSAYLMQTALLIRPDLQSPIRAHPILNTVQPVQLGLYSLEKHLTNRQPLTQQHTFQSFQFAPSPAILRYVATLVTLAKKVYQQPRYRHAIAQKQQQLWQQWIFFNYNYHHPQFIAAFAQAYSDTAGQCRPTLMVKGSAQFLQNPHQVAYIRSLLFCGLQAAHYWHQWGGRGAQLIFARRRMLKEIRQFADVVTQLND